MYRALQNTLRDAARDEGGAIAVLFALLLLPMLGVTLTAIDYGRALRLEGRLQTAVDSATSAAVKKVLLGYTEVEAEARRHLDQHLPDDLKGMAFELAVDREKGLVDVRVATTISTSMIGLLGLDKFTVRAASQARAEQPSRQLAKQFEAIDTRGLNRDVARTLEDLERQARSGGGGGGARPTREQEEEIKRAAEEANRLIQDALRRIR